jgi:hypothetical protein
MSHVECSDHWWNVQNDRSMNARQASMLKGIGLTRDFRTITPIPNSSKRLHRLATKGTSRNLHISEPSYILLSWDVFTFHAVSSVRGAGAVMRAGLEPPVRSVAYILCFRLRSVIKLVLTDASPTRIQWSY